MELNIIELTKNYFDNTLIDKIAQNIGEDPAKAKGAVENTIASLLAAIMDRASTTAGLLEVASMLEKYDSDDLMNKLSRSKPSQFQILTSIGTEMLPGLLGEKAKKISHAISTQHGLSNFNAMSLLSLVAPVLVWVIGKYFKTSGMSISALANLLMGQKDLVKAALPTGLLAALNFPELGDYKGSTASAGLSTESAYSGQASKKHRMGWLPLIIGILALLAVVVGVRMYRENGSDADQIVSLSMDSAANSTGRLTDSLETKVASSAEALGDFFKKKLPSGYELSIPRFGMENQLISFLEDTGKPVDKTTWFDFDRINFETGSANLSRESLEQTQNIAEILRAFPEVSIKVGGYTDNTGDPAFNLKLSQSRAEAVKASIVSEGIDQGRITAEGYGKEHPVASNDTAEGRAENRRIAVRVTAK